MSETRQATPLQAEAHAEAPSLPSICTADVFSALTVAAAMGALYFVLGFALRQLTVRIAERFLSYHTWLISVNGYLDSAIFGLGIGLFMFIVVCVDLIAGHLCGEEMLSDVAYFPRLWNAPDWASSPKACMTVIFGLHALGTYYALFALEVIRLRYFTSFVGPDRLFVVLLLAWGVLWFADTQTRPRRTTNIACVMFVLAVFLIAIATDTPIGRD